MREEAGQPGGAAKGGNVQFDQFTIVLAMLRTDAPELDEEAADALQNAHMAFLADLHGTGHLPAGGPLDDPEYRGLSIMKVDPERALELRGQDPAVLAGRLSLRAIPWTVPGGAVHFSPTRFPRSVAEATSAD
jgi:uncharacterized protein